MSQTTILIWILNKQMKNPYTKILLRCLGIMAVLLWLELYCRYSCVQLSDALMLQKDIVKAFTIAFNR